MVRYDTLSRRPANEQPPTDMRDDKTANTTADYTHIPLPSLVPSSIPCPASDRCATAVPVGAGASRRSSPAIAISRFCPVLGWRTMIQLFARRAAESNAFSVPDHNALWSRQRMTSLYNLYQSIVLLTFSVVIGARLHGSCPGALRSSAKSVTTLLIL